MERGGGEGNLTNMKGEKIIKVKMQVAFRRSNHKAKSHPPFEIEQFSDQ